MRPPDNGVICWEQSARRPWPSSHWLLVLRQLEMIQESAERIGLYAQFLWNLKLQIVWIIENNSRTTAAKPNITKYSLKLSNWGFPSVFLDSYTAWEGRAVWIQVTGLLVFMGSKTWRGIFPRNSFVESRSLAQQISQPEPQNTRNTISSSTLVLVWGEELSPDWPWAKSQVFSSNNEIWISKYTVLLLIKCTNLNLDPREEVCSEPSLTTGHLGLEGQDFHPIPVLSSLPVSEGGWSGDLEIVRRYGPWATREYSLHWHYSVTREHGPSAWKHLG